MAIVPRRQFGPAPKEREALSLIFDRLDRDSDEVLTRDEFVRSMEKQGAIDMDEARPAPLPLRVWRSSPRRTC